MNDLYDTTARMDDHEKKATRDSDEAETVEHAPRRRSSLGFDNMENLSAIMELSLIHISEPTRR